MLIGPQVANLPHMKAFWIVFVLAGLAVGQPKTSPVLRAMQAELDRSLEKLKTQPTPPYYLRYEITETHTISVVGAFGKITNSGEYRNRQLDIDLRVGDYNLDNTREIRGSMQQFGYSALSVPIHN